MYLGTLVSLINVQDVLINLRYFFSQEVLIKGRTFINFGKNFWQDVYWRQEIYYIKYKLKFSTQLGLLNQHWLKFFYLFLLKNVNWKKKNRNRGSHPSWRSVWFWKIFQTNDSYPAILWYFRYPKQERSKFFN